MLLYSLLILPLHLHHFFSLPKPDEFSDSQFEKLIASARVSKASRRRVGGATSGDAYVPLRYRELLHALGLSSLGHQTYLRKTRASSSSFVGTTESSLLSSSSRQKSKGRVSAVVNDANLNQNAEVGSSNSSVISLHRSFAQTGGNENHHHERWGVGGGIKADVCMFVCVCLCVCLSSCVCAHA